MDKSEVKVESSMRNSETSDMYVSFTSEGKLSISVDGCCGGGCMVFNYVDENDLLVAIKKAKGLESD